ncbi:MAG: copper resistance protein NlpE [Verrucomicrobiales bacterium]|jgi:uncharacterized lipoprotein NlpE involved in copper resistance|nr:copper resistance protein NlpE [Verrucomicrobiales bacterium]
MKKFILSLAAVCAVVTISACKQNVAAPAADTHNSRNSLDWAGVYTGTIPGADVPGIKVQLTLNADETYTVTHEYLGKEGVFTDAGKFQWDQDGGVIMLDRKGAPTHYQVGENQLMQLDLEGKPITGDLAKHYILKKKVD